MTGSAAGQSQLTEHIAWLEARLPTRRENRAERMLARLDAQLADARGAPPAT